LYSLKLSKQKGEIDSEPESGEEEENSGNAGPSRMRE